jgi:hypothetical protein
MLQSNFHLINFTFFFSSSEGSFEYDSINTLYLEGNFFLKKNVNPYPRRQINIPTLPTLVPITWAIGLWVVMKCEIRDACPIVLTSFLVHLLVNFDAHLLVFHETIVSSMIIV